MSQIENFAFFDEGEAKRVFEKLKKYTYGVVKRVERKVKRVYPPPLHSLTSLQREANKKLGFSAKKTLDVAQMLYETYKVISYPRTESRYLATSNRSLVEEILKKLGREDLIPRVAEVGRRVFDDTKLTDHHAIIPLDRAKNLPPDGAKLYDLILKRFLAVFYPPYVYESVLILTEVGNEYLFLTRLRRTLDPGWRVVYGFKPEGEGEIPPLRVGDKVKKVDQRLEKKKTEPPPRYTEGTLLKEMERLGLGTPATRAQIIETLKARKYVTKRGKVLIPTEKGRELIEKLKTSKVASPEMTAEWEKKLEEIHLKGLGYRGYLQFLEAIKGFTAEEVDRLKETTFEVSKDFKTSKGRTKRKTYRRGKKSR